MDWMIRYVSVVLETYFLEDSPELFHYLSQSGCVKDRSLDDKQLFDDVMVISKKTTGIDYCLYDNKQPNENTAACSFIPCRSFLPAGGSEGDGVHGGRNQRYV